MTLGWCGLVSGFYNAGEPLAERFRVTPERPFEPDAGYAAAGSAAPSVARSIFSAVWHFLPTAFLHFTTTDTMIATPESLEPHSSEQLPNSNRVYVEGTQPGVRVPMREIALSPTKSVSGQIETNEPVRVYDTSGPWGDPAFDGDVEKGLPALRADWIRG